MCFFFFVIRCCDRKKWIFLFDYSGNKRINLLHWWNLSDRFNLKYPIISSPCAPFSTMKPICSARVLNLESYNEKPTKNFTSFGYIILNCARQNVLIWEHVILIYPFVVYKNKVGLSVVSFIISNQFVVKRNDENYFSTHIALMLFKMKKNYPTHFNELYV